MIFLNVKNRCDRTNLSQGSKRTLFHPNSNRLLHQISGGSVIRQFNNRSSLSIHKEGYYMPLRTPKKDHHQECLELKQQDDEGGLLQIPDQAPQFSTLSLEN